MELVIKKLNQKYGKCKIKVYNGKKLFGEITEFCYWISLDPKERETKEITLENCMKLRKIAMENLWWLLHTDTDNLDEDVTEEEAWKEKVGRWNKGHGFNGWSSIDSLFFPGEYEIALNSINNK